MLERTEIQRRSETARKGAATRARLRALRGASSACSRCGAPRDTGGSWCRACRAAYMREDYRQRPVLRKIPREKSALAPEEEAMVTKLTAVGDAEGNGMRPGGATEKIEAQRALTRLVCLRDDIAAVADRADRLETALNRDDVPEMGPAAAFVLGQIAVHARRFGRLGGSLDGTFDLKLGTSETA